MKNRHCSGRPGQVLLGHHRQLNNGQRFLTEASRDQGKHQPLCIAVRMVLYWCPRHLLCGIGVRVSDEASVLLLMVMPVAVVVIEQQQHKRETQKYESLLYVSDYAHQLQACCKNNELPALWSRGGLNHHHFTKYDHLVAGHLLHLITKTAAKVIESLAVKKGNMGRVAQVPPVRKIRFLVPAMCHYS